MKFFIHRTSQWDDGHLIEVKDLKALLKLVEEKGHPLVLKKNHEHPAPPVYPNKPYWEKKKANGKFDAPFILEIYDDYRE